MKALFEKAFRKDYNPPKDSLAAQILTKQARINNLIAKNAPAWPINQIATVDLATLQLAIWEIMFSEKKEPYKVVIDEAIEIAKEFGGSKSPKFINGVLGSIVKSNTKVQK